MTTLALVTTGFASGVLLRSFFVLGWPALFFVILLALVCLGYGTPHTRHTRTRVAVFLFLLALGIARTALVDTPLPEPFAQAVGENISYEGTIVSDPDVRDTTQRVTISISDHGATTRVLAIAPRYPRVSVGERVHVYGTLALPESFASDGGRVFRYDTYLQKSGVRFVMNFAALTPLASAPWWSPGGALAATKHAFIDGIDAVLPEPYASLASGIVIGGKQGLGADLLTAFTLSGLVQIVVLSGYNVMVVAEAVMAGLQRLRLSRRSAAAAGGIAVLLFVLIAGAGAATLRAGLMALIALYARATGRTYAASRALLIVVLAMLALEPLLLAFDPGFDLSVAATAGLIWLTPVFELYLARIRSAFWKNALATTLAAQVAVLPLLLYDIGTLSLVAIPANLLTLPVVPATMAFSALAGAGGMIFGTSAFTLFLALPAYLLTGYLILVARLSAAIPFAAFTLPAFPWYVLFALYAFLIAGTIRAHTRNAAKLRFAAPRDTPPTQPPSQTVPQSPSN